MEKINGNTDSFMYGYLCTTGEPLKRPASNKVAWHPSCRLNTIHVPGVTLPNISSMLPTPRPTPLNSPMPRKKLTPKKTTPKCKKAILSNEPSPVPAPSTPERAENDEDTEVMSTPQFTPQKPDTPIGTPVAATPTSGTPTSSATTPTNATTPKGGRLRKEQVAKLEKEYELNKHPNKQEKTEISERLEIPYNKITTWFQSQRTREKRLSSSKQQKENLDESMSPLFSVGKSVHSSSFVVNNGFLAESSPSCNLEDQFTEVMERPSSSNLIGQGRVSLASIDIDTDNQAY